MVKQGLRSIEFGSCVVEMSEMESGDGEEGVKDVFVAEAVLGGENSPYCLCQWIGGECEASYGCEMVKKLQLNHIQC